MSWKPIAEAPKQDDIPVLLASNCNKHIEPCIASWDSKFKMWFSQDGSYVNECFVTHFMIIPPLPPAPEAPC